MSKHIHLIGIGGIGMSGIARLLREEGHKVSGSDIKETKILQDLRRLGAQIYLGHCASHVKDADLVVYSSAITQDNPEIREAQSRNIPVVKRAQMLAELMQEKKVITVTGAHGKTTTSSLAAHLLKESGLSPTAAVGGILRDSDSNVFFGKSIYFVAEADESDGSFLYYKPDYSIITNLDYEHLDYYGSFDNLTEAFRKFLNNTKPDGCVFCCGDDVNLRKVLSDYKGRVLLYGLSRQADIYAAGIKLERLVSSFDCFYNNKLLTRLDLPLGGTHNVVNSLSVVGLGLQLGVGLEDIKKALATYKGAKRRMEIKLDCREILIIDDYAHHPTEIKATLSALVGLGRRRIIAVFQPHRYSRTRLLSKQFGESFRAVDCVIVTDIYPAGEQPIAGVDAGLIYESIKKDGHPDVRYLPKEDIVEHLLKNARPKDLIVTLGAGDITRLSDELAERFNRENKV